MAWSLSPGSRRKPQRELISILFPRCPRHRHYVCFALFRRPRRVLEVLSRWCHAELRRTRVERCRPAEVSHLVRMLRLHSSMRSSARPPDVVIQLVLPGSTSPRGTRIMSVWVSFFSMLSRVNIPCWSASSGAGRPAWCLESQCRGPRYQMKSALSHQRRHLPAAELLYK